MPHLSRLTAITSGSKVGLYPSKEFRLAWSSLHESPRLSVTFISAWSRDGRSSRKLTLFFAMPRGKAVSDHEGNEPRAEGECRDTSERSGTDRASHE